MSSWNVYAKWIRAAGLLITGLSGVSSVRLLSPVSRSQHSKYHKEISPESLRKLRSLYALISYIPNSLGHPYSLLSVGISLWVTGIYSSTHSPCSSSVCPFTANPTVSQQGAFTAVFSCPVPPQAVSPNSPAVGRYGGFLSVERLCNGGRYAGIAESIFSL